MHEYPVACPSTSVSSAAKPPPLLDRFRQAARARGDSAPTTDTLVAWTRAFILFHNKRHPSELGLPEVTHFLEHVVKTVPDPLPALAQARAALTLLYGGVLGHDLGELPHPRPPRLLDQLRLVLRVRHYSRRTEDCYVSWAKRFILFHHQRHPRTMGAAEVEQFLTHLAVDGHVSASSQNQALNALLFFYGQVLEIDLGKLDAVRARRGKRLPIVLTPEEVRLVLGHVLGADGLFRLMARLLYGCGLRVTECCTLRVHDLDLGRGQILVRGGKGNKDRVVMLPRTVRGELEQQLAARRTLHERDVARGVARVDLPDALERKYPRAAGRSSGSSCSRRGSCRIVPGPGASAGTTSWRGRCNGPWRSREWPRVWTGPSTATPFATVSPRTSSNAAPTFGRCNCSSATKAWKRP